MVTGLQRAALAGGGGVCATRASSCTPWHGAGVCWGRQNWGWSLSPVGLWEGVGARARLYPGDARLHGTPAPSARGRLSPDPGHLGSPSRRQWEHPLPSPYPALPHQGGHGGPAECLFPVSPPCPHSGHED